MDVWGVMVIIIIGNGQNNQIQDEAVCISHNTITIGKGMHPTILPPAMNK